jgi:hypothetical protein
MRDKAPRTIQKVSCLCGAEVCVDPQSRDRQVVCPACRSTFAFVVTMDPKLKNSRLSLVLSPAAMKRAGESFSEAPLSPPPKPVTRAPKRSSGKTIHVSMARCECGAVFPLEDTGELTTLQSCPQCNRVYHVVFKIEHGSKEKSGIIVPQGPIAPPGGRIRAMPTSKPARSTTAPEKVAGTRPGLDAPESSLPAKKNRSHAGTRGSTRPPRKF